ncbi:MAG: CopG family transcriptional regulator [Spirochaetales bacterium]|nr:CopG family transcriptional regulator [Spirochaetales bacterium]
MAKTITMRVDERLYKAIKLAASAQNRTVSNYLETAARSFILEEQFVSDEEMSEIIAHPHFDRNFKNALADVKKGHFEFVR